MPKTTVSLVVATVLLTWGCGGGAPRLAFPDDYAEIIVPTGTTLAVSLDTELASDVNRVEDLVLARVDHPVTVDGVLAIPEGSMAYGTVTRVKASGKVRGRAQITFRFDHLYIDRDRHNIRTQPVSYEAESTKSEDAKKIGVSAAAGSVLGGLLRGKKGAGAGAAIGGGAGTVAVLATAGKELLLIAGTPVKVSLTHPLVLLIPLG